MPNQGAFPLTLPRGSDSSRLSGLLGVTALALALVLAAAVALVPANSPPRLAVNNDASTTSEVSSIAREPAEAARLVEETSAITTEAAPITEPPAPPDDLATAAVKPAQPQPRAAGGLPVAAPASPPPPPAAVPAPEVRWRAEGFLFVFEGQEWDDASVRNVDAALSALPARIRGQLANRALGPVNILVNREGRSLSGKQPYGGPANYFSTNDGRNELVLFPGQSVQTILHELGHAYNLRRVAAGRYATVLLDPQMQSFMAATGWRIISTAEEINGARDHMQVEVAYDGQRIWPRLSNDDPLEDFANSFALYFISPSELASLSGDRFAWFEANVGR